MKRYLLVATLFLTAAFAQAQTEATEPQPPYKRFPTLPPLDLLLGDSTTTYTKADIPKKKSTLVMVFNPDCSHCQHEAEQMVLHKDELRKTSIIMVTMQPIWQMNQFIKAYHLDSLPGLVAGKDIHYSLLGFYSIRSLPYLAVYNKKGELVEGLEGSQDIEKIIGLLNGKAK